MLSFYPFSTYLIHLLSYVGQTVQSESILSTNCATIQESLQNYFKLKKLKAKNLLILIQNVCKRMAAPGGKEQAERTIFQLLLQQITGFLEVTKIQFDICLTFFLQRF